MSIITLEQIDKFKDAELEIANLLSKKQFNTLDQKLILTEVLDSICGAMTISVYEKMIEDNN